MKTIPRSRTQVEVRKKRNIEYNVRLSILRKEFQWSMVVNFFYRFRSFEGCHRANLIFPNDPEKYGDCLLFERFKP